MTGLESAFSLSASSRFRIENLGRFDDVFLFPFISTSAAFRIVRHFRLPAAQGFFIFICPPREAECPILLSPLTTLGCAYSAFFPHLLNSFVARI